MMNILEKVSLILTDVFNLPIERNAKLDERLIDDLGMDSLDLLELAMYIETEFDIYDLPDTEIWECKTVSDVVELVKQKIN